MKHYQANWLLCKTYMVILKPTVHHGTMFAVGCLIGKSQKNYRCIMDGAI